MAYFRNLPNRGRLLSLLSREQRWLIVINADPDAMASAMALRRILSYRVQDVAIAKVNEISRPDNLAMVRYTRLHMQNFHRLMLPQYDFYALVDSQPHHHPSFKGVKFSIVVDHHPLPEIPYADAVMADIRPAYGATATIMTEYLYNLKIRPGKLLATALQFAIKTDTDNFERHFFDADLRAYQYLSRFADKALLSRIARSEFRLEWLTIFARACTNLYGLGSSGQFVYVGQISSPDVLVNIADFFMRVYEIRWVAVAGAYAGAAVVIFRGDGIARDVGRLAADIFGDLGSAGGHRGMARAEFPLSVTGTDDVELFIWKRLTSYFPAGTSAGRAQKRQSAGTKKEKADRQKPVSDLSDLESDA